MSIGGALKSGTDHGLRADARRNHDGLIQAAQAVFAEYGVDAPIKTIADRANVGVGTLYRRFPKRSDLIIAVFHKEVEACAGAAATYATFYAPFEALSQWIDRLLDLIVTKRGLAAGLQSSDPAYAELKDHFEQRLTPALQMLLKRARGDIHVDISAADLWSAVARLCAPAGAEDFDQARRMVALLVNGLRVAQRPKAG